MAGIRAEHRCLIFRIDFEFLEDLEERCLELARYANQNIDDIERWPFAVLFRRYRTLSRVVKRETAHVEK